MWTPARQRVRAICFRMGGDRRPPVTHAVSIAELARASAMARFGRQQGGIASPLLAGKDPFGVPLSGHQHSHFLVTDEDGDGYLDHLAVWTPAGLGLAEVEALTGLTEMRGPAVLAPLQLSLCWCGGEEGLPSGLGGESAVWQPITPFVPVRHPKVRRGVEVDGLADQVRRELDVRGLGDGLEAVTLLSTEAEKWASFQRARGGERRMPPLAAAFGFRLCFKRPVRGPITLGYGAHFSLGLFGVAASGAWAG